MAGEKIRYANGCSPLERETSGVRWYRDSDIQTKPSGSNTVTLDSGTVSYTASTSINDSATQVASSKDFVYIKNTGSTDVLITLDNSNYLLTLSEGESFASEIAAATSGGATAADVRVKTLSGSSTIETLIAT